MHVHSPPSPEVRALLEILIASEGFCGDLLRMDLVDTGFVRRDSPDDVVLHLTPEGHRFLQG